MRSLHATLMAGLAGIAVVVVGGLAGVVYARARRESHGAMRQSLRLHAETLAGLLEVGRDGIEFESRQDALASFREPRSGAYARILAPDGKVVVRSPSLGPDPLPPPPPWEPGLARFEEVEAGPGGIPCALLTLALVATAEKAAAGSAAPWTPPPEEARRYRIQVALDSRERDRGLAELAAFLGAAGAGAVGLAMGAGLLLSRAVLRPIRRMTVEAESLSPAEPERRLHPSTHVAELHRMAATLNSALDRLGDALERQRSFTTDAGHELRTPVSILMAGTELLLRRPRTPEEYRDGLEKQLRTIRRMKGIAEDLLALARADAGAEDAGREPVALRGLVESVCDEHAPLAEEKGVRLVREGEADPTLPGDRRSLGRLVGNLLSNAIKFTPSGGQVTVRLSASGPAAEIAVSDSGPGVPGEHRARIFERFHRVQGGRVPGEGAGLGLAIALGVAKAHGGTIAVEDRPGGGAVFRARLPLGGR